MARVNINGVLIETAKVRGGTKCKCCGREFATHERLRPIKTHTKTCAVAYVCNECVTHMRYGADLTNKAIIGGKLTSGNYRFAVEIEAMYRDENILETDAFLAANYGIQPSQDSTVDVEYHMVNRVSFHGLKDFMQGINEVVELTAEECGHHINISKNSWTAGDMGAIRRNGIKLFRELASYMETHNEDTVRLFGRGFNPWCTNNNYYMHGSWLNLDNTFHMEFRLPHYSDANQFFYCTMFCRDIVDIVDKWLNDEISTQKASNIMVKKFITYADNKAACQRAERNKKER